MDEGSRRGADVQNHLYNGKELDRMHGLNLYDYSARQYDAAIGKFTSMDPLCEKYYHISPYAYCAGNPVNCLDINGDSVTVLTAPDGAHGFGHAAILIQDKENKWRLYSKNGTNESSGSSGPNDKGNDEGDKPYDSPEQFINSEKNRKENGDREYTEGYVISCSDIADEKAEIAAKNELKKNYNLLGSNCIVTVQKSLNAAGLKDGSIPGCHPYENRVPNKIYERIKSNNPGGTVIKPKIEVKW